MKQLPHYALSALTIERIKAVRQAALRGHKAGLNIVPAAGPYSDQPKRPLSLPKPDGKGYGWKFLQYTRTTERQVSDWFQLDAQMARAWYGTICGAISGNLECLEFENLEVFNRYLALAEALGLGEPIGRIRAGYEEYSAGGPGIHWLMRSSEIEGNQCLASRPKSVEEYTEQDLLDIAEAEAKGRKHIPKQVLIETRGEGGFIILAPTAGLHANGGEYRLVSGGFETIATVTPEERRRIHALARTLDEAPEIPPSVAKVAAPGRGSPRANRRASRKGDKADDNWLVRPGDDFNDRASWDDILPPTFTHVHTDGGIRYWRRQGKNEGWSGTTGFGDDGADLLYVFSTSTSLKSNQWYTKFSAYVTLLHGGGRQGRRQEAPRTRLRCPQAQGG